MLEPEIPAQHKECACCEKILPFSEFRVIHQRGKEKLFSYCHACFKIKTKTYYKNDLESKAKRAEYERARYRLLKEKDPEGMRLKFLTIAHRRRMRHRLTGSKHTVEASVYRKVFERDGYKCLKCGTMERLELDHIVPITKGGASVLDNLQVLCRSCNASKFVKIIDYRVKA
jgi:5-methylcytosine-specific restriction endonuclease McrA